MNLDDLISKEPAELDTHCGMIAIVGRPNVGKSTLLNYIVEQKVSITSRKPQTTRHRIMGIHTEGKYQAVYVDTPGLHVDEKRAINRLMNRAASSSIGDVELIIFVLGITAVDEQDRRIRHDDRRAGGTREPGQPEQTLELWWRVFVQVLVVVRDQQAINVERGHALAQ